MRYKNKKGGNPFANVKVYVGKMKPLNQGLYKRDFIESNSKPLTKVYIEPSDEYLFTRPFKW